jgi:hypothetical protein
MRDQQICILLDKDRELEAIELGDLMKLGYGTDPEVHARVTRRITENKVFQHYVVEFLLNSSGPVTEEIVNWRDKLAYRWLESPNPHCPGHSYYVIATAHSVSDSIRRSAVKMLLQIGNMTMHQSLDCSRRFEDLRPSITVAAMLSSRHRVVNLITLSNYFWQWRAAFLPTLHAPTLDDVTSDDMANYWTRCFDDFHSEDYRRSEGRWYNESGHPLLDIESRQSILFNHKEFSAAFIEHLQSLT